MSQRTFVSLGRLSLSARADRMRPRAGPRVAGVLYRPDDPGDRARVGLIVMHETASFLEHPSCAQLADRGYTDPGMDAPIAGHNLWEELPEYQALECATCATADWWTRSCSSVTGRWPACPLLSDRGRERS